MQQNNYIEGEIVREGRDSFDIGQEEPHTIVPMGKDEALVAMLSNPKGIMSSLNLTAKQAENVNAIIAGAGAGAGYKLLSRYIGGELASAVGGFLAAHIVRRLSGE